jgi:hypothetical protein
MGAIKNILMKSQERLIRYFRRIIHRGTQTAPNLLSAEEIVAQL